MALFSKDELSSIRIFEKAAAETADGKTFDIFLSHSYSDRYLIKPLRQTIEEMGFSVYVDWIHDSHLDRTKVNKDSAVLLRKRMKQCNSLFFAISANSTESRWMPWALGYFDAFGQRVAILPLVVTATSSNDYKGQEYLGLYPYVTKARAQGETKETLWIRESEKKYVWFSSWLKGEGPSEH